MNIAISAASTKPNSYDANTLIIQSVSDFNRHINGLGIQGEDLSCLETLAGAFASALIFGHLDLQKAPGEAGENAAIRGVMQSIIAAMAFHLDDVTQ